MEATLDDEVTNSKETRRPTAPRKVRSVVWWAGLGVAQLLLAAYVVYGWAANGHMEPSPKGPDRPSDAVMFGLRFMEVAGIVATVLIVWHFLVRPWRRDGRLSTDGMLLIACFAMAIPHDIMLNHSAFVFSYNAYFVNWGSWLADVPGTIPPGANHIPEPLVLVLPAYGWCVFLASVLGCWVMRTARARRPALSTGGLLAITFGVFFVLDIAFENLMIRMEVEAYGGTIRELTLFNGTRYTFPIYEAVLWGAFWTAISALRFFRDDKGRTIVERGVDDLGLGRRGTAIARQLAFIGAGVAIITVTYNAPWQYFATRANQYPVDMPSYLTYGICGPDTPHPCLGPGTPVPRTGANDTDED